jgi:hypothetical protein
MQGISLILRLGTLVISYDVSHFTYSEHIMLLAPPVGSDKNVDQVYSYYVPKRN